MTGEVDLPKLIKGMKPELNKGEYVYCLADSKEHAAALDPLCYFLEKEGVTVILPKEKADAMNIPYDNDMRVDHAHGSFFARSCWLDCGGFQSPDRGEHQLQRGGCVLSRSYFCPRERCGTGNECLAKVDRSEP